MSKKKKVIIIISVLAALIIAVTGFIGYTLKEEIMTILSITPTTEKNLYIIDCSTAYDLDGMLKKGGISTSEKLIDYLKNNNMKFLPINNSASIKSFDSLSFEAKTQENTYLTGTNFLGDKTDILVVSTHPSSAYASLSLVPMNFLGVSGSEMKLKDKINLLPAPFFAVEGINEKGLCVSLIPIKAKGTNQENGGTDVYPTLAVRAILDKSATVEEAVSLLRTFDIHHEEDESYQFMLSDETGASAVVSFENGNLTVTEKENNFQICTGFYLNAVPFEYEKTGTKQYDLLLLTMRTCMGTVSTDMALDALDYILEETEVPSEQLQWSVVFDIADRSLELCCGGNFSTVFTYKIS